jgi:hypothetical protein
MATQQEIMRGERTLKNISISSTYSSNLRNNRSKQQPKQIKQVYASERFGVVCGSESVDGLPYRCMPEGSNGVYIA